MHKTNPNFKLLFRMLKAFICTLGTESHANSPTMDHDMMETMQKQFSTLQVSNTQLLPLVTSTMVTITMVTITMVTIIMVTIAMVTITIVTITMA